MRVRTTRTAGNLREVSAATRHDVSVAATTK
jgi:hypothetical protein